MKRVFYLGDTDFRKEARCTVQNYLLLAFSIVMMSTVVAKCEFRANVHPRVYTDIRTTLL
jgi:thymidine kinase